MTRVQNLLIAASLLLATPAAPGETKTVLIPMPACQSQADEEKLISLRHDEAAWSRFLMGRAIAGQCVLLKPGDAAVANIAWGGE